jgi:RimJ/RimL family protein N-acetyltransferase
MVKATVLFQYLGAAKFKEINKNTKVIKGLTLNREPGTLQLEHGYTKEKFRRQGIFTNVIKRNIKENLQHHNFSKVQGILFNENYKSFKAHLKLGYNVIEEKKVEDPEILKYFPYNSKVLMELSEENFQNF